jgi:hypothetical protein
VGASAFAKRGRKRGDHRETAWLQFGFVLHFELLALRSAAKRCIAPQSAASGKHRAGSPPRSRHVLVAPDRQIRREDAAATRSEWLHPPLPFWHLGSFCTPKLKTNLASPGPAHQSQPPTRPSFRPVLHWKSSSPKPIQPSRKQVRGQVQMKSRTGPITSPRGPEPSSSSSVAKERAHARPPNQPKIGGRGHWLENGLKEILSLNAAILIVRCSRSATSLSVAPATNRRVDAARPPTG